MDLSLKAFTIRAQKDWDIVDVLSWNLFNMNQWHPKILHSTVLNFKMFLMEGFHTELEMSHLVGNVEGFWLHDCHISEKNHLAAAVLLHF